MGPDDCHGQRRGTHLAPTELYLQGPQLPATRPGITEMAAGEASEWDERSETVTEAADLTFVSPSTIKLVEFY